MDTNTLKRFSLFALCSDAELALLMQGPHKERTFAPGEIMVSIGTPCRSLMLLTEGTVETRMGSVEGRELVVDTLKAPCVLAPAFLFATDNIIPVEVTAVGEATLMEVNREAFTAFMQRNPPALRAFLTLISNRAQFLSGKVRSFAIKGLRNRVLDYLALHGTIDSVAHTAEVLGVARPSLSRLLSELVDEGRVVREGNCYRRR